MIRQLNLRHVDVEMSKRMGRAERGPTARRRWAELKAHTVLEGGGGSVFWLQLVRLGVERRWWTMADVRLLLRPYGCILPALRKLPEPLRRKVVEQEPDSIHGARVDVGKAQAEQVTRN